jgi:hypothetical protein
VTLAAVIASPGTLPASVPQELDDRVAGPARLRLTVDRERCPGHRQRAAGPDRAPGAGARGQGKRNGPRTRQRIGLLDGRPQRANAAEEISHSPSPGFWSSPSPLLLTSRSTTSPRNCCRDSEVLPDASVAVAVSTVPAVQRTAGQGDYAGEVAAGVGAGRAQVRSSPSPLPEASMVADEELPAPRWRTWPGRRHCPRSLPGSAMCHAPAHW